MSALTRLGSMFRATPRLKAPQDWHDSAAVEKLERLVKQLEEEVAALRDESTRSAANLVEAAKSRQRDEERARWRSIGDLRAFERKVYSQNGEDGIIQEILQRIGAETRYFVEFGVESGVECNCALLALQHGWSGLFMEASDSMFGQLAARYANFPAVRCAKTVVTSANIEGLLETNGVPTEFDLLAIDIDGNDYWVWSAIRRWRPRIVVVEYNSSYAPPRKWVMKEDIDYRWNGTNYFGASLASLTALGRVKGYTLVGTNSTGINAFFVRDDLVTAEKFLDPVLHYHYSPPNFGPFLGGHPMGGGPFVEV